VKKLIPSSLIGLLLFLAGGSSFAQSLLPSTSGAGWIPGVAGGKATFGVSARIQLDGTITGNLVYMDHDVGLSVTKTSIAFFFPESLSCQSEIAGTGDSNFGPVEFIVSMRDNGEPGRNRDTFTIQVGGAITYGNSGVLEGGNIHCP
jgi:hypothetical protein